jgi:hypothetical protein
MRVRKQQLKLARGYDDRRRVQRDRISGGEHSPKTVAPVDRSRFAGSPLVAVPSFSDTGGWFAGHADSATLLSLGFRLGLGGTHLARTIMLAELGHVLKAVPRPMPDEVNALVVDENILQKRTGSSRRLSLRHLRELYGLGAPPQIMRAMIALWASAGEGQPVLALLVALAREVLLRDSADTIFAAPPGASVVASDLAALFERHYPGRYSQKMLRSLSQNCASSWTQSGHLKGKVRKERARPAVSPTAAAYAALLGSLAGSVVPRCSHRHGSRSWIARRLRCWVSSETRKWMACSVFGREGM